MKKRFLIGSLSLLSILLMNGCSMSIEDKWANMYEKKKECYLIQSKILSYGISLNEMKELAAEEKECITALNKLYEETNYTIDQINRTGDTAVKKELKTVIQRNEKEFKQFKRDTDG